MSRSLAPDMIIGHYRIVSKIGAGGMGEVYLAKDTKLDRKVAIKFLHEAFSKDVDKLNRFIQEAKAASALNHPNILTVYEIGEVDGKNYIATELIDGSTLREHLSHKEPLRLNQILKIGVQVAEALAAAHQAGIIHRDIKPENIMLRKDGYAKVLDFGLAKLSEPGAITIGSGSEDATRVQVNTSPGMVMGTVCYMSPEQARGKVTDARTDIWSLGVVLYEMLSGKVPFSGETVNHTIVSILEKEPPLLTNVPSELQRIVRKSMTKDVEMRYQTAHDLLIDLKNLRRDLDIQGEFERSIIRNRAATTESANENQTQVYGSGSVAATSSGLAAGTVGVSRSSSSLEYAVTQAKSHKLAAAIVALLLVVALSAAIYFGFVHGDGAEGQINSIAVLPFENRSGNADSEYLSDGLTESLIYRLSQLPNLKVSPANSVFRYKGKDADVKTIGSELGVNAVMVGRMLQRGQDLTISVELIDATNNKLIWGEQYDRKSSDLLTTQREIAAAIVQKLQLKFSGSEAKGLAKTYTESNEAYQHYLKGRFYWNKRNAENLRKAIDEFSAASEKDPNYALAYVGLADCYVILPFYDITAISQDVLPKAKAYAARALEIDPSLGEAHASLAYVHYMLWNWAEAEAEFERAIELSPNYATGHKWYGNYLEDMRRDDESLREFRRAQELDPLSLIIAVNLADRYLDSGDLKSAYAEVIKVMDLDPSYAEAQHPLSLIYLRQGKKNEALAAARKGVELSGRTGFYLSNLGFIHAQTGNQNEALNVIKELEAKYSRREATGYHVAAVFVGLGDKDSAFSWLEKDFRNRTSTLVAWMDFPPFDSLRDDSRMVDLRQRMGLPQ